MEVDFLLMHPVQHNITESQDCSRTTESCVVRQARNQVSWSRRVAAVADE
jgi:hypothetical protein